jgi:hypothetical protein
MWEGKLNWQVCSRPVLATTRLRISNHFNQAMHLVPGLANDLVRWLFTPTAAASGSASGWPRLLWLCNSFNHFQNNLFYLFYSF